MSDTLHGFRSADSAAAGKHITVNDVTTAVTTMDMEARCGVDVIASAKISRLLLYCFDSTFSDSVDDRSASNHRKEVHKPQPSHTDWRRKKNPDELLSMWVKKDGTTRLPVNSRNIDRFLKFFHPGLGEKFVKKTSSLKLQPNLKRVTTLRCIVCGTFGLPFFLRRPVYTSTKWCDSSSAYDPQPEPATTWADNECCYSKSGRNPDVFHILNKTQTTAN